MLKEKTALEETVAALTSSGTQCTDADGTGDNYRSESIVDGDDQCRSPGRDTAQAPGGAQSAGPADCDSEVVPGYEMKVKALSETLNKLMKEKNDMEARFKADKKLVADAHRSSLLQATEEVGASFADAQPLATGLGPLNQVS